MDNNAQMSLEYLLIFAISMIILIAFTIPLTEMEVENTLDVSKSLNTKSEISKISNSISQVYSEGQGSKQTVHVKLDENIKLNIASSYLSCNLKLNDKSTKLIKVSHKSNLKSSSMSLIKGDNLIVVEWPVGSEKMIINKKLFN